MGAAAAVSAQTILVNYVGVLKLDVRVTRELGVN